jgi:hypothetical protein
MLGFIQTAYRRLTADRLCAWPYDIVEIECDRCGKNQAMSFAACRDRYGLQKDLRELVREGQAECGRAQCKLWIKNLDIPQFYR